MTPQSPGSHPVGLVAWQPRRGRLARAARALTLTVAAVWRALLAAAPAARLWAKILAAPALIWVLVHFAHLVVDRPWPGATAVLRLGILRRAIDWSGFLACAAILALVGMRVRAERAAGAWKVELGREDAPDASAPDTPGGAAP